MHLGVLVRTTSPIWRAHFMRARSCVWVHVWQCVRECDDVFVILWKRRFQYMRIYATTTATSCHTLHSHTRVTIEKCSEKRKTGPEDEKEKKPTNSCYVSGMSYYICNVKHNTFFRTEKEMILSWIGGDFVKLNCLSKQLKLVACVWVYLCASNRKQIISSGKMCDLWLGI